MTPAERKLVIKIVGVLAFIGMITVSVLAMTGKDVPTFFELVTAGAVSALGTALAMRPKDGED